MRQRVLVQLGLMAPATRKHWLRAAALIVTVAAAAGAVWRWRSPRQAAARPNVVIILVDTLRADHLGLYGYSRPTSPNIDRLGARSYVFDRAVAQSSWTAPSVASLFTSTYPTVHGVYNFTAVLPGAMETLAEVLARQGYATAGFSANFVMVTARKGFAQGFDTFAELKHKPAEGEPAELFGLAPGNAPEVTDRAIDWLEHRSRRPFLLYLQYMDPHASYHAPSEFRERFAHPYSGPIDGSEEEIKHLIQQHATLDAADLQHLTDLYDAEIAFADAEIGRLFARLKAAGLFDTSIIVLLSDHGEELQDHGSFSHSMTLYRELTHVPLILHLPHGAGRRISRVVQLIDVGPTILDLVGLHDPRRIQGVSMTPLLTPEGDAKWLDQAYSELYPDPIFDAQLGPKKHRAAVVGRRWSYLQDADGDPELYDLEADPKETHNLAAAQSQIAGQLAGALREHALADEQFPKAGSQSAPLRPEDKERLRALGYMD